MKTQTLNITTADTDLVIVGKDKDGVQTFEHKGTPAIACFEDIRDEAELELNAETGVIVGWSNEAVAAFITEQEELASKKEAA